jgi:DNA-binding NarL/FixJ family response regulator
VPNAPPEAECVRAAEVIGALSLATDLGMGLPFEHGLQSTLFAARLSRRLGVDPDLVAAVFDASGQPVEHIERPAGLTDREAEVLRLLARGLQTKQIAATLGISPKTADRHIQNVYGKIGVSSRAAATLFAMEHGLMAWGELPDRVG